MVGWQRHGVFSIYLILEVLVKFIYNVVSTNLTKRGCCCPLNQTYGFQLLLEREGPMIYDHGCGVDQYILNREPAKFEYLHTLGFMNIFVF